MNNYELMKKTLASEATDRIPVGFWFHFPPSSTVDELVEGHLSLLENTDIDFLKIMYEFAFPIESKITYAADWLTVRPLGVRSKEFKDQIELIKRLKDKVGDSKMMFATSFSPTKLAVMNVGDAMFMDHSKNHKDQLKEGIKRFSESLEECNRAYLEEGIDGIYYSGQFSEPGRFEREEWEELVADFDKEQIHSINEQNKYVLLHICGEPEYNFKSTISWYRDYDVDMFNWATYANGIDINEGRELFDKPVLGGVFNRGSIANGSTEEVEEEVKNLLDKVVNKTGFVVGADCTIQGGLSIDNIATAVKAVRRYGK